MPVSAVDRIAAWAQARPDEPQPARIRFRNQVDETTALRLVQEYGLQPTAVFFRIEQFQGTHRLKEASVAVLDSSRASALGLFQKSFKTHPVHVQRFLTEYSLAAIERDPLLATPLRSLVGQRIRLHEVIARIERGEPIIYGLEVLGQPANLERLIGDFRVTQIEPAYYVGERLVLPRLTPLPYLPPSDPPQVAAMSVRQLYELAEEEVASSRTVRR